MRAFHETRSYHKGWPVQIGLVHNMSFLAHWHHDLEFIYVRHGSVRVGINSEVQTLQAGEFAFCGSGDIHYYEHTGAASELIMVIFNPRLIGAPAGWPTEQRQHSGFILRSEVEMAQFGHTDLTGQHMRQQLGTIMEQLLAEQQHQQAHAETVITGLLHMLGGLCLRCMPAHGPAIRRRASAAHLAVMQRLLDWLEQHCTQPLTLQDGADQAGMSVFHFSRFFKNVTGIGYNTYINELRIQRAEQQMTIRERKLIDIALDCGFGNVRTFNRVFRQLRGCSPSERR
ncbi:AraC family transcriptional regulator [Paenibacillus campi]|uniref:AraC family transcriptional regulator n=1 Tax=Paenibacillus campi TaxID=3106031 RepID=UPI002AFFE18B|nr:AraC family transcriptional regulator [Paenibacillus sp. SGZ-1009]